MLSTVLFIKGMPGTQIIQAEVLRQIKDHNAADQHKNN